MFFCCLNRYHFSPFNLLILSFSLKYFTFSSGIQVKRESNQIIWERKYSDEQLSLLPARSKLKNPLEIVHESNEITFPQTPKSESYKVCQTLILNFVREKTEQSSSHLNYATGFLHKIEYPLVIFENNYELNDASRNKYNEESDYFKLELHVDDLYSPLHFPSFHFIPQCSIVLLSNPSESAESLLFFEWTLQDLLKQKIVKSYRDYFTFFGHSLVVNNLFKTSKTVKFIGFKYGLFLEEEEEEEGNEKNGNPIWVGLNFCEKNGQKRKVQSTTAQVHVNSVSKSDKILSFNIPNNCNSILSGTTIVANAVAGDQFVRFENNLDGSLKSASGIYALMLIDISKRQNFTIRMYGSPGSGSKKNGKYNGALGELSNHRADLSLPTAITESRNGVIDYTSLVAWFDKVFWIAAPRSYINPNAVVKPFSVFIWSLLLVSVICFLPIFYCFLKTDFQQQESLLAIAKNYEKHHKSHINFSKPTTFTLLIKILDIIIRLLLEQSTLLRNCVSSRLRYTIAVWSVFALIMGTGYRSKLFYFLTFMESEPIPRTHEELAYSDYKLYFRSYGGVALRYVTMSQDPKHKAMVKNNRLQLESTTAGCIQRVLVENEKSACMDYGFSGEYSISTNFTLHADAKESRVLVRSSDVDGSFQIIWAFPKNSPLTRIFTKFITWHHASGMYNRWVDEDFTNCKIKGIGWLKTGNSTLKKIIESLETELTRTGPQRLSFQSLHVAYEILCGFYAISAVILMLEFFYYKLLKIKIW